MYVYGGYITDKAEYLSDILAFNIENNSWEIFYKSDKTDKEPGPRSNFSMVESNRSLFIFGGSNGTKTLNDTWSFSLKDKKWTKVETKDPP